MILEQNHPSWDSTVPQQCLLIVGCVCNQQGRGLKSAPGSHSQGSDNSVYPRWCMIPWFLQLCKWFCLCPCRYKPLLRVKLAHRNFPLWQSSFLPELDLLSGGKGIAMKLQLISLSLNEYTWCLAMILCVFFLRDKFFVFVFNTNCRVEGWLSADRSKGAAL